MYGTWNVSWLLMDKQVNWPFPAVLARVWNSISAAITDSDKTGSTGKSSDKGPTILQALLLSPVLSPMNEFENNVFVLSSLVPSQ
jgi:hypothetical protein